MGDVIIGLGILCIAIFSGFKARWDICRKMKELDAQRRMLKSEEYWAERHEDEDFIDRDAALWNFNHPNSHRRAVVVDGPAILPRIQFLSRCSCTPSCLEK